MYLDCRILPGMTPKPIYNDLKCIIAELGMKADIELFLFRQGYEADNDKIAPFIKNVGDAHKAVFGTDIQMTTPVFSSMWRDHSVFNEYRVPSITYGPSRYAPTLDDMVNCAKAYALMALEVAMQDAEA